MELDPSLGKPRASLPPERADRAEDLLAVSSPSLGPGRAYAGDALAFRTSLNVNTDAVDSPGRRATLALAPRRVWLLASGTK